MLGLATCTRTANSVAAAGSRQQRGMQPVKYGHRVQAYGSLMYIEQEEGFIAKYISTTLW